MRLLLYRRRKDDGDTLFTDNNAHLYNWGTALGTYCNLEGISQNYFLMERVV
jgi:hypothetical protein